MGKPGGLTISDSVIDRLRARVRMDGERQLQDFVCDALDTYVALGGLVAGGAELQVRNPGDGSTRRVRLPFELRRASARPEAEAENPRH